MKKQSKSGTDDNSSGNYLGTIAPDSSGEGIFYIKKYGIRLIDWSTEGPEGWKKVQNNKNCPVVE